MKVEINNADIIAMLKGIEAPFCLFEHPMIKGKFIYYDQYGRFVWDKSVLNAMNEGELWDMYLLCKKAWLEP